MTVLLDGDDEICYFNSSIFKIYIQLNIVVNPGGWFNRFGAVGMEHLETMGLVDKIIPAE